MLRLFFVSVLLAGLIPAAAAAQLDRYPAFASRFVMPREVTVWTPDGYDPKGPPLAVVYMHDGENLYEASRSLSHADWQVGTTVTQLIREKKIPPVIVVGIESTALRGREYLPRKWVENLPPAVRDAVYTSWNGTSLSDDYLRFVVEEVKPFVDAHYNTRRDAAHTAIIGSSMGGLISLYAMAEYPGVFGQAGCLSLHWLLGSPLADVLQIDRNTYVPQVVTALDAYLARSGLTPADHRLYVDRGDQTLDQDYVPFTPLFDDMMARRGWVRGPSFASNVFPGKDHTEQAWAERLAIPLQFLLRNDGP